MWSRYADRNGKSPQRKPTTEKKFQKELGLTETQEIGEAIPHFSERTLKQGQSHRGKLRARKKMGGTPPKREKKGNEGGRRRKLAEEQKTKIIYPWKKGARKQKGVNT